ncbi:hypothetical protein HOY80DRAFT_1044853 [Tuber brumale]|nr:hypothetical protein HOY80DRAFT_1044853 [Tuber brumale]
MLAISRFPIKTPLSQFERRDYTEDKGAGDNDGNNPVAIVGLVVAALTLLVGLVSLRSSRFRRRLSYLLPSYLVKRPLGITHPKPSRTTITTTEDFGAVPLAEISIPSPVFIYNYYSNAKPAYGHSNLFQYAHTGFNREYGRIPRAEEPQGPERPEPVVTRQLL